MLRQCWSSKAGVLSGKNLPTPFWVWSSLISRRRRSKNSRDCIPNKLGFIGLKIWRSPTPTKRNSTTTEEMRSWRRWAKLRLARLKEILTYWHTKSGSRRRTSCWKLNCKGFRGTRSTPLWTRLSIWRRISKIYTSQSWKSGRFRSVLRGIKGKQTAF